MYNYEKLDQMTMKESFIREENPMITYRVMTMEDYDGVYDLWMTIKGFGIRSIDDSREGVEKFLKRNPTTSVVALDGDKIIGSILCGHDGRRACFYHVCVAESYRKQGIGKHMAAFAEEALKKEGIKKQFAILQINAIGCKRYLFLSNQQGTQKQKNGR